MVYSEVIFCLPVAQNAMQASWKKDKMSANVTVNALSCMDIVEKFILLNAVKSRQMKIMAVFQ